MLGYSRSETSLKSKLLEIGSIFSQYALPVSQRNRIKTVSIK